MRATKEADGQVTLSGQAWSDTFPASDLLKWVAFYDRMFCDYGRDSYRQAADALRALAA